MFKNNASGVALVVICALVLGIGLLSVACIVGAVAVPRVVALSGSSVKASHPQDVDVYEHVGRVDTTIPAEVVPLAPDASGAWVAQKTRIDLEGKWKFCEDVEDKGYDSGWAKPEFDDSKWKTLNVPGDWESQGITTLNPAREQSDDLKQPYTGFAWYRKSVVIPVAWKGKTVMLHLGRIDDLDWTRVNNRWIGETSDRVGMSSAKERVYTVPPEIIRWGKPNVIAIRVEDNRGLGGIVSGPVYITCADQRGSGSGVITSANDAVQIGSNVNVQAGQSVNDAVAVGGSVNVHGTVQGDAVAVGGPLNVYGTVQGDAVAVGGIVHIHPGGRVGGDTVTIGGGIIEDEGSTRGGQKVVIGALPWDWATFVPWMHGMPLAASLAVGVAKNLLWILLALLTLVLFTSRCEIVARVITEKPGYSFAYGVGALLLIIPVGLFLLVTCIGIPLILVEFAILLVAKFLGFAGLSLAIGWKLGDATNKPVTSPAVAVLLGGLTLTVIGMLPFLGGAVDWVLKLFGFGAVFITGFGASADWIWNRKQNGAPPPGPIVTPTIPPAQE